MKVLTLLMLVISTSIFAKVSPLPSKNIVLTDKNSVVMNQAFTFATVAQVQQQFMKLSALTTGDLFLVLDTPGGSISAGQLLIDFLNTLPNKVHTVTIFAASMGYITVQSLGKRYIIPSGKLMSHRAAISGLSGQIPGEATSRVKHISALVREISQNIAKRVGVSYRSYMKSIYNELWLTSNQAVKLNHADAVANVTCGKSLQGTYSKSIRSFFGTFNVTFSKCPLIRGPLKINAKNNYIHKLIEDLFNYERKKNFDLVL
jgi:ATP-dependent Clp protease protease subunit